MTKAHIILVHGAYHQPHHWNPLLKLLQEAGYPTSAPRLPSTSLMPTDSPFEKDKASIRQAISDAIDNGATNIVPVFHSYAGVPGFETLATLAPEQKTKIARIVCISSFMFPKGGSLVTAMGGQPADYTLIENGGVTVPQPIPVFYNDVDPAEAADAAASLMPTAAEAFLSTTEHEGWAEFPVTYVLCREDNALGVPFQQEYIDTCRSREGRKGGSEAVEVAVLESSHSPMLSMPGECFNIIRKAAGET